MPPKVSIVLPVRNEEKFLKECLKSILQQTLSQWELIAVDDHSTDESYQILETFAQRDSRVRIFKNPDSGISDCLNFAIYLAKSPLIARMDGDDLMEPKRMEIQVDHLDKNTKVGLVASQVEPFPKAIKNQRKGYELYVQWTNEILTPKEHSMNRFVDCPFAHPSIIFRRSLIDCYGGYTKGILPEDFELWLRWMGHGVVMEKLPQVLLKWRDHPKRASRTNLGYTPSAFQKVKAKYLRKWLEEEFSLGERIILCWGAGRVARELFSLLKKEGIKISGFIDLDPKKMNKQIATLPIIPIEQIPSPKQCFILILAGARGVRKKSSEYLQEHGYVLGNDFLPLA